MNRDLYRRIGAISGLVIGILVMRMLVQAGAFQSGILPMAIFGAGGTVVGGMSGERLHARKKAE